MLIPEPELGQTRDDYVQALMTDPAIKAKYPAEPVRLAFCHLATKLLVLQQGWSFTE